MILRAVCGFAFCLLVAFCGAAQQLPNGNVAKIGELPTVCPPEGDDNCLLLKMASFTANAVLHGNISDPYAGYREACERSDADGCFALGSLYELSEGSVRQLPAIVLKQFKRDSVAAAAAYEKSCALGSALGCATAANMIAPDEPSLERASIENQVLYMDYQRRSCEAGWLLSCEVFIYDTVIVSSEEWPGGEFALNSLAREAASLWCASGSLDGCYHEGFHLMLMGYAEGGNASQVEDGWQIILNNCAAGNELSCDLVNRPRSD